MRVAGKHVGHGLKPGSMACGKLHPVQFLDESVFGISGKAYLLLWDVNLLTLFSLIPVLWWVSLANPLC